MIVKCNQPKNVVIVVHKICGVNQHMKDFSQSLQETKLRVRKKSNLTLIWSDFSSILLNCSEHFD